MASLPSVIGQHFAYAHGRMAVLQQHLLRQQDIDRLLGSHDLKEAEKILTEIRLTDRIDQGVQRGDEIVVALEEWTRKEVLDMSPPEKHATFSILWMKGDMPLLAYLLKKKLGMTSDISELPKTVLHAYDATALQQLVNENKEGSLPSHLVTFVRSFLQQPASTPRLVDTAVAQFMATTQLRLARAGGCPLIKTYVVHSIDLQNIRTALRFTEETPEERSALLLDGGTIAKKKLTGNLASIRRAIDESPLAFTLTDTLVERKDNPSSLERALADVVAMDIAKMWNIPLSIEPLFAFASIALMDITLVRAILIGKANGLSPQEIKKMLPPFIPASHYVTT